MATPNYEIEDKKTFADVEAEQASTLNEIGSNYDNAINTYQEQIDKQSAAIDAWAAEQKRIQQAQTDFAIQKINQQKEQATQDYTKEQSAAYADWQKQSNQYGANAEKMAAQGMANTGFAESSQVAMYNTYQNRVAVARETINRNYLEYDNMMKDARLQNSAALAEIAYNTLLKKNELALAGFQYKNDLIMAKSDKKLAVDEVYHDRWQDVLNQINTENSLAETVRQYNENMAFKEKEYQEGVRQFNAELALKNAQLAEQKRQFNEQQQNRYTGGSSGRGASNKNYSSKRSTTTNKSYKVGVKNTKSSSTNKSTYSQAADKMKKAGAISAGDGGLMTKTEWQRRKASGSKRAETSYATYNDYVNSFTAWRIANPEK